MDQINSDTITINCSVAFKKRFLTECRLRNIHPNKAGILSIKKFFNFPDYKPKQKIAE